jgi:hypothetical protein
VSKAANNSHLLIDGLRSLSNVASLLAKHDVQDSPNDLEPGHLFVARRLAEFPNVCKAQRDTQLVWRQDSCGHPSVETRAAVPYPSSLKLVSCETLET